MLDDIRNYFHGIVARFEGSSPAQIDLDELRTAWRRARSNAEASVDRMQAEPGVRADALSSATSILASSRALVRSVMGIEAMLLHKREHAPPENCGERAPAGFHKFALDVEFTLYYAASALRGSHAASEALPLLREDQRRLVGELDATSQDDQILILESDRLTVSLNTLREQVQRCVRL
jgi:hypothetical protein